MYDPLFAESKETHELLRGLKLPEILSGIHLRVIGVDIGNNREMLGKIPYKRELDLAFVYFIEKEYENCTELIYINNEMLDDWKIDASRLHELALENTVHDRPAVFMPLDHAVGESERIPGNEGLFILSTKGMFLGSCAMFYPGRLKEISGIFGCDLTILPSSVHECIVLPGDDTGDVRRLYEIVKSVNDTVLAPEDILSYSVYRYSAADDELVICRVPLRD